MATPAEEAIAKLNGDNADTGLALPWTGVTQYQEWALGKDWVNRPAGADNGADPANGHIWWSPSQLDHVTVLSEILTKKYHGCTVLHMLTGLFAVLVEGHDAADVRKALGLPDTPKPLTESD